MTAWAELDDTDLVAVARLTRMAKLGLIPPDRLGLTQETAESLDKRAANAVRARGLHRDIQGLIDHWRAAQARHGGWRDVGAWQTLIERVLA